ncbi:MAG: type IIL restriction-modification enzyme MmeI, partial [Hyphomicrobium sp.]
TDAQVTEIERLAQAVLDARESFPEASLDVLYDQDSMPPALRKAHSALDKAVDRLYRRKSFDFERERVEHLFELYEKTAAPMDRSMLVKRKRRARTK